MYTTISLITIFVALGVIIYTDLLKMKIESQKKEADAIQKARMWPDHPQARYHGTCTVCGLPGKGPHRLGYRIVCVQCLDKSKS